MESLWRSQRYRVPETWEEGGGGTAELEERAETRAQGGNPGRQTLGCLLAVPLGPVPLASDRVGARHGLPCRGDRLAGRRGRRGQRSHGGRLGLRRVLRHPLGVVLGSVDRVVALHAVVREAAE